MDAQQIHQQIIELRDGWNSIWWAMAKGNKLEYDAIKATPVLEYWAVYDLWITKLKAETQAQRSRQSKK